MPNINLVDLNRANPAPFSSEKMIDYYDYIREKGLFFKAKYSYKHSCIPIKQIIGVTQGNKAIKWGDALQGLERIKDALQELKEKPNYYKEQEKKDYIGYFKVNNNYYADCGIHRTVVARFLLHFNPEFFGKQPVLGLVGVREMDIDYDFIEIKTKLESLINQHGDLEVNFWPHDNDRCVNPKGTLSLYNHKKRDARSFHLPEFEPLIEALQYPKYVPSFFKKPAVAKYDSFIQTFVILGFKSFYLS